LIAEGLVSPWQEDLHQLAKFPNVSCKLSGMVTGDEMEAVAPS
jgi:predicted TIM-barrel fold metal-dependent hydrolase